MPSGPITYSHTSFMHPICALKSPLPSVSGLTAIFPGGPGLAGTGMSPFWILLELRMKEVVVTARATGRASSSQIVTTNKPC